MTTIAILLPGPVGFHLFVRWPRDRVRRCSVLVPLRHYHGREASEPSVLPF